MVLSVRPQLRRGRYVSGGLLAALGAWWCYQVFTAKIYAPTGGGVVKAPRIESSPQSSYSATDLVEYSVGKDIIESGIPFNCYGWDRRTGLTGAMVVLFLRSPVGVELELRGVEGVSLDQRDWDQVRVRIGLRSASPSE